MVQPLVLRILRCSTNGKKFLPRGGYFPFCEKSIVPIYTKITYDLTTAIINKCFEFQNDWLKIILDRYNCTQFCPIPLC